MGLASGPSGKKDLNFELNLIPVFDILSVCICFLLMTVVWVHVGSMNVSQAIGGQSAAETKKSPTVWATIKESGATEFTFRNMEKPLKPMRINGKNGRIDIAMAERVVKSLENRGLEIALVMPSKNTKYNDVIQLMDLMKSQNLKDVGLAPL